MSISQRKFRAFVGEYHDAGSQGEVDSTYLVKTSGDPDQMWWCSKAATSGYEKTIGMQPDHQGNTVFGFAAHCPVTTDDAILCDGKSYLIHAVLDRDYGRDEVQVLAEYKKELVLIAP